MGRWPPPTAYIRWVDETFLNVRLGKDKVCLQVIDWDCADGTQELVALAAREIAEALGAPPLTLVDSHVQRWGGGLPQYTVGHQARIARVARAVSQVPGLEVAGAAYQGIGIPAVIASAHAAAGAMETHLRAIAGGAGE